MFVSLVGRFEGFLRLFLRGEARDKVASGGGSGDSGPKGGMFPWRLEYVLGDA